MKTRTLLTLASAICLFILTPGVPLLAGTPDEAIRQLEQARTSPNPFPYVERAKQELEESGDVSRGHKLAALRHLEKAVDYILIIKPKSVEWHIDHAIYEIAVGHDYSVAVQLTRPSFKLRP